MQAISPWGRDVVGHWAGPYWAAAHSGVKMPDPRTTRGEPGVRDSRLRLVESTSTSTHSTVFCGSLPSRFTNSGTLPFGSSETRQSELTPRFFGIDPTTELSALAIAVGQHETRRSATLASTCAGGPGWEHSSSTTGRPSARSENPSESRVP
jgi:hypothetical protein